MAKTKRIDRLKIAALLIFVAVAVALAGWTIWDAFAQTDAGGPVERGYQAVVGTMVEPTPTTVQATMEPLPTDPYPMEN